MGSYARIVPLTCKTTILDPSRSIIAVCKLKEEIEKKSSKKSSEKFEKSSITKSKKVRKKLRKKFEKKFEKNSKKVRKKSEKKFEKSLEKVRKTVRKKFEKVSAFAKSLPEQYKMEKQNGPCCLPAVSEGVGGQPWLRGPG